MRSGYIVALHDNWTCNNRVTGHNIVQAIVAEMCHIYIGWGHMSERKGELDS